MCLFDRVGGGVSRRAPKLTDLRREIQEMLCAHEAFRRLGFSADDIFVTVGVDPKYGSGPQVFVDVTVGVEFSLRVCDLWCDERALQVEWHAAVALWNDPKRYAECASLWDASELSVVFDDLANAVRQKGLAIPAVDEAMAEIARIEASRLN